ncbi:MAG: hypothetical protein WKF37_09510 [Bryobacteraceae bacterium]
MLNPRELGSQLPGQFNGAAGHDADATGLDKEQVLKQLARVLVSQTFARSKRLGRFLSFTVEQSLAGRQGEVKEYLVGVEVFNKHENFDPRIDSIVRVEARRLRSKMERYYSTEGMNDATVIQFRKGSYVPLIGTREQIAALALPDLPDQQRRRTLAIARFCNASSDPPYESFCAGLTQDLISALTKIPKFRLLTTSNAVSPIKPDYLLEGSIRKQANRVRISTQLIDTGNSSYLWSETYDRDITDAFAVQDEIVHSIQTAVRFVQ